MRFTIKKGLDIPIAGEPEQVIHDGPRVTSVALLGDDYIGMKPRVIVKEQERVKLGQPLFIDRALSGVHFTAPGSGVVSTINRGPRRSLKSIVIQLAGDEKQSFPAYSEDELAGLQPRLVKATLLGAGLWTAFRTRPYSKVPVPETTPASIFVTAMDSNPLAARADVIINAYRQDFVNGLTVITHLTQGKIFVCKAPGTEIPQGDPERTCMAEFAGPHPAGLVGTHIHFLQPVSAGRTAWHLNYQDVIAIGKLFTTGRVWVDRIVALAGPLVTRPRLIRTRLGANTDELVQGELGTGPCRIISGSLLSGRWAAGQESYLGRFHGQVSVLAEGQSRGSGWFALSGNSLSATSPLPPALQNGKYVATTALHGMPKAMVSIGTFERVMPLDILPTQLLRTLLVGDTSMAAALGCLELDEEDLALCTFVCPSKCDYGTLLRRCLTRIEQEG